MNSDSDKEGVLQRKNDLDEGGRKVFIMCVHTLVTILLKICTSSHMHVHSSIIFSLKC